MNGDGGAGRIPRDNNFHLIRLLAALQVVVMHSTAHLDAPLPEPLGRLIGMFHGVPIFFFISGLLVASSLDRRSLADYAEARARRIFPALWLTFALTLGLLWAFGQLDASQPLFWAWAFTQVTVLQVYSPETFSDFGVGVVNGSLWTIPVEVGFYFALPAIALVATKLNRSLAWALVIGTALSFPLYHLINDSEAMLAKLVMVTPIAHFWLFALGSLTYLHFDRVMGLIGRLDRLPIGFAYPLVAYVLFRFTLGPVLPEMLGDAIAIPLLLAGILSAAFVAPRVNIGKVDLSYSTYLFHMLVVNALVEAGVLGWRGVALTFAITLPLAWLSWTYVEAPALGHSSRNVGGFMVLRRIGCLFGKHERSRGKAREHGMVFVSECSHCGVPMEKRNGEWSVVRP